nr:MAG TPA: hypothetical protein [Caudoviricetes sp.]
MANPNTLFSWMKYQDIQLSDVALRSQFEADMSVGNYAQALQLLSNNQAQFHGKSWIGDSVNTIITGILTIENLYGNGVINYLSDLTISLQSLIDNYRNMETYDSSKEYKEMNFVSYNEDMYMALQEIPVGTLPTDNSYWLYIGLKGEQGASGVNVRQQYDYSSAKTYQVNDIVVYQNQIYVALKTNIGIAPTDETNWLLYQKVIKGNIFVGVEAPTENLVEGKVWFKTKLDPYTYVDNSSIVGTFMVYHENGNWEEMYPNTVFNLIDMEQYSVKGYDYFVTINQTDWSNQTVEISKPQFTENSIVNILPESTMTEAQWKQYNFLESVVVSNGKIIITASHSITENLPIKILIR